MKVTSKILFVKKNFFFLLIGLVLYSQGGHTEVSVKTHGDSSPVVGLPYSTQWQYERINSFLLVNYNTDNLQDRYRHIDHYSIDYNTERFAYPSIDFYSKFFSLAGVESQSYFKNFSIWGRYSLGAAVINGKMNDLKTKVDTTLESSSLAIFLAKIGFHLSYDRFSWIQPIIGAEIVPYVFRQTGDLPGVDEVGANYVYDFVAGALLPVFLDGRGTFLLEFRRTQATQSSEILGNSNGLVAGVGVAF